MNNKENPYRSSINTLLLRALFYETTSSDKKTVLYTLKDEDHKGYTSLYKKYMEMEDITEYEFANSYLDGWEHWETLCECEWFKPFVQRWRKELELKVRGRALKNIQNIASDPQCRSGFTANKFLLEKGWEEKDEKGRPSKQEVKKKAKEEAENERIVKHSLEAISQELDMEDDENADKSKLVH